MTETLPAALGADQFAGTRLSDIEDRQQWEAIAADCRRLILANLAMILDRAEAYPDYPYVNTKLRVADCRDFFDSGDPIRGRGVVFGWIQGRGVEALATHAAWIDQLDELDASQRAQWTERIDALLTRVIEQLERIRGRHNGRLAFMMDESGQPLRMTPDGPVAGELEGDATGISDTFYAKGLAAAGARLGRRELIDAGVELYDRIITDINAGRYRHDQQPLSPPATTGPGGHSHAPHMLMIGAATVMLQASGEGRFAASGRELMDHVARYFVQHGEDGPARRGEMWEFISDAGQPNVKDGALYSDPGHAIEYAGLALRHLRVAAACGQTDADDAKRVPLLCEVVSRNFANGFREGTGIVKAWDLIGRRPLDGHMPWWSLPETMRSAAEAVACSERVDQAAYRDIFARCSNAFFDNYVRKQCYLLAVQALEADGSVAMRIPGVADVDPSFHTGLSLIDALDRL